MESDQVKQVLLKVTSLPEGEVIKLMSVGKIKTVQKGSCFIRAGEVPRHIGFVIKGLFRYVYLNKDGAEFTKNFIPENHFIASYSSMIQKQSSWFSIEALEDAEVLKFDYTSWMILRESAPCWDKFLIALLERAFITKEKRERELLLLDAETRYQIFLNEFPGLENRIRQHLIASYLGIKPESLSRIRKKLH